MEHHEAPSSAVGEPYSLNNNNVREYIDMSAPTVNLANIGLDVNERTLCSALQNKRSDISSLILDNKSSKVVSSSLALSTCLSHLTALQYVQISNSKAVNDSVIQVLGSIDSLNVLILDGCKRVSDASLWHLQNSTSLQYLSLKNVPLLNTQGMVHLSPLIARNQLISLYLRGNTKITDESVKALLVSKCQSMTTIDLSKCHKISNQSLARIAESFPNLENLLLYGCPNVTDIPSESLIQNASFAPYSNRTFIIGLCYLFPKCTSLKHLDISHCPKVTDQAITVLATLCTNIEVLLCGGCRSVSDVSMSALTQSCFSLKQLDFSEAALTDAGIRTLTRLTNLQSLNVRDCARLTDASVQALSSLPYLCELNLKQCNHLTDLSVEFLQSHFGALQKVNLRGYSKISIEAIGKLRIMRPDLLIELNWD